MTVDRLSSNRVLVILKNKDMENLLIDFDTMSLDDLHSRKALLRIINSACRSFGIEASGKSICVEAMSFEEECYLLLTLSESVSKDRETKSVCYCLGESSNFLDALEKLYRQNVCCNKNSAYEYKGEYYLIFDYPSVPNLIKRVMSEYAKESGKSVCSAKIKENGRVLCEFNAIFQIGRHLI